MHVSFIDVPFSHFLIADDLVSHYLAGHPVEMFDCSQCQFSSSSAIEVMVHFSQNH